jgi:uncharacterized protein YgiM (DUF1202 family)
MRKIALSFVLSLIITPAVCIAFSAGFYETKENLNVRSTPQFGNNRIDYYEKGTPITVSEVEGEWCRTNHYKYAKAYVRCNYLQLTDKVFMLLPPPEILKNTIDQLLPSEYRDKFYNKTYIGKRTASKNVNVRSNPKVSNNLIGYIKKGTETEITEIKGNWCKIPFKTYKNAYVYCSLFGITEPPTYTDTKPQKQEIQNSVAIKTLNELYDWTMNNNEAGRFYINNSGKIGREKATKWQSDAVRAGITFNFPDKDGEYCTHYFVSATEPDKIFQYNCAAEGNEGIAKITPKKQIPFIDQAMSADFKVPFAALIARMLDGNGEVWPLLQNIFADSEKVQMDFTLSADEQGTFWTVKIYDGEGYSIKLMMDATAENPSFMIF